MILFGLEMILYADHRYCAIIAASFFDDTMPIISDGGKFRTRNGSVASSSNAKLCENKPSAKHQAAELPTIRSQNSRRQGPG